MNNTEKIEELGEKYLAGEITLEQHVEEYNRLVSEENSEPLGFKPHEHI